MEDDYNGIGPRLTDEIFTHGIPERIRKFDLKGVEILPDTGARTNFDTGAVRDASVGKGLPSHIPPIAIRALAKRFEDGARKYKNLNWMLGINLSRYIDAIFRHTLAWSEGQTDEDHGGAVLWNMATAMWTLEAIREGKLPKELNDLPYYVQGD